MGEYAGEIITGLMVFLGGLATAWVTYKVGTNSTRQESNKAKLEHELGLIDRYEKALETTDKRLSKQIDELRAEVRALRQELHSEQSAKHTAERQRDAAIDHARELREAWPGSTTVPAPPEIIRDFLSI